MEEVGQIEVGIVGDSSVLDEALLRSQARVLQFVETIQSGMALSATAVEGLSTGPLSFLLTSLERLGVTQSAVSAKFAADIDGMVTDVGALTQALSALTAIQVEEGRAITAADLAAQGLTRTMTTLLQEQGLLSRLDDGTFAATAKMYEKASAELAGELAPLAAEAQKGLLRLAGLQMETDSKVALAAQESAARRMAADAELTRQAEVNAARRRAALLKETLSADVGAATLPLDARIAELEAARQSARRDAGLAAAQERERARAAERDVVAPLAGSSPTERAAREDAADAVRAESRLTLTRQSIAAARDDAERAAEADRLRNLRARQVEELRVQSEFDRERQRMLAEATARENSLLALRDAAVGGNRQKIADATVALNARAMEMPDLARREAFVRSLGVNQVGGLKEEEIVALTQSRVEALRREYAADLEALEQRTAERQIAVREDYEGRDRAITERVRVARQEALNAEIAAQAEADATLATRQAASATRLTEALATQSDRDAARARAGRVPDSVRSLRTDIAVDDLSRGAGRLRTEADYEAALQDLRTRRDALTAGLRSETVGRPREEQVAKQREVAVQRAGLDQAIATVESQRRLDAELARIEASELSRLKTLAAARVRAEGEADAEIESLRAATARRLAETDEAIARAPASARPQMFTARAQEEASAASRERSLASARDARMGDIDAEADAVTAASAREREAARAAEEARLARRRSTIEAATERRVSGLDVASQNLEERRAMGATPPGGILGRALVEDFSPIAPFSRQFSLARESGNQWLTVAAAMAAPLAALTLGAASFNEEWLKAYHNTDLTRQEALKFREEVKDLARVFPVAPKDLFESYRVAEGLRRAGQSKDDTKGIVRAGVTLSVADAADARSSVEALATVMSLYKINAADAMRVTNLLAMETARNKITTDEMVKSQGRALALAAQYKIPLQDAAAALGVFTHNGLTGSQSSTAFRQMLTSIIRPTQQVRDLFAQLKKDTGVDLAKYFTPSGLQSQGLFKILDLVNKATKGNIDLQAQIFHTARDSTQAIALLGRQYDLLHETASAGLQAWKDNKRVQDNAAESALTFGKALQLVSNEFQVLSTDFQPYLIGPLTAVAGAVDRTLRVFEGLPPGMKRATVDALALGAGFSLVVGLFLRTVAAVPNMLTGLSSLGRGLGLTKTAGEGAAAGIAGQGPAAEGAAVAVGEAQAKIDASLAGTARAAQGASEALAGQGAAAQTGAAGVAGAEAGEQAAAAKTTGAVEATSAALAAQGPAAQKGAAGVVAAQGEEKAAAEGTAGAVAGVGAAAVAAESRTLGWLSKFGVGLATLTGKLLGFARVMALLQAGGDVIGVATDAKRTRFEAEYQTFRDNDFAGGVDKDVLHPARTVLDPGEYNLNLKDRFRKFFESGASLVGEDKSESGAEAIDRLRPQVDALMRLDAGSKEFEAGAKRIAETLKTVVEGAELYRMSHVPPSGRFADPASIPGRANAAEYERIVNSPLKRQNDADVERLRGEVRALAAARNAAKAIGSPTADWDAKLAKARADLSSALTLHAKLVRDANAQLSAAMSHGQFAGGVAPWTSASLMGQAAGQVQAKFGTLVNECGNFVDAMLAASNTAKGFSVNAAMADPKKRVAWKPGEPLPNGAIVHSTSGQAAGHWWMVRNGQVVQDLNGRVSDTTPVGEQLASFPVARDRYGYQVMMPTRQMASSVNAGKELPEYLRPGGGEPNPPYPTGKGRRGRGGAGIGFVSEAGDLPEARPFALDPRLPHVPDAPMSQGYLAAMEKAPVTLQNFLQHLIAVNAEEAQWVTKLGLVDGQIRAVTLRLRVLQEAQKGVASQEKTGADEKALRASVEAYNKKVAAYQKFVTAYNRDRDAFNKKRQDATVPQMPDTDADPAHVEAATKARVASARALHDEAIALNTREKQGRGLRQELQREEAALRKQEQAFRQEEGQRASVTARIDDQTKALARLTAQKERELKDSLPAKLSQVGRAERSGIIGQDEAQRRYSDLFSATAQRAGFGADDVALTSPKDILAQQQSKVDSLKGKDVGGESHRALLQAQRDLQDLTAVEAAALESAKRASNAATAEVVRSAEEQFRHARRQLQAGETDWDGYRQAVTTILAGLAKQAKPDLDTTGLSAEELVQKFNALTDVAPKIRQAFAHVWDDFLVGAEKANKAVEKAQEKFDSAAQSEVKAEEEVAKAQEKADEDAYKEARDHERDWREAADHMASDVTGALEKIATGEGKVKDIGKELLKSLQKDLVHAALAPLQKNLSNVFAHLFGVQSDSDIKKHEDSKRKSDDARDMADKQRDLAEKRKDVEEKRQELAEARKNADSERKAADAQVKAADENAKTFDADQKRDSDRQKDLDQQTQNTNDQTRAAQDFAQAVSDFVRAVSSGGGAGAGAGASQAGAGSINFIQDLPAAAGAAAETAQARPQAQTDAQAPAQGQGAAGGSSPLTTPANAPAGAQRTERAVSQDLQLAGTVAGIAGVPQGSPGGDLSAADSAVGAAAQVASVAKIGGSVGAAVPVVGEVLAGVSMVAGIINGLIASRPPDYTTKTGTGQQGTVLQHQYGASVDSGYSGADGMRTLLAGYEQSEKITDVPPPASVAASQRGVTPPGASGGGAAGGGGAGGQTVVNLHIAQGAVQVQGVDPGNARKVADLLFDHIQDKANRTNLFDNVARGRG